MGGGGDASQERKHFIPNIENYIIVYIHINVFKNPIHDNKNRNKSIQDGGSIATLLKCTKQNK